MKDCREEWYDAGKKVAVTLVDVITPAQELARGHLSGPVAAYYLSEALAAAALFGGEISEKDETVILQMKCTGPLGGFNVECTAAGTLRGYTEKKTLEDFDGLVRTPVPPKEEVRILGAAQFQITRSVPGRILSQGIASTLNGYLRDSLQRNAVIALSAAVSDEVEILAARGILVEALPDAPAGAFESLPRVESLDLSVSPRNLLGRLGLDRAELRRTAPLAFACRCSPERALAVLSSLPEKERAELPPSIDITCHMCGRTFTVKV